jgi:hypothetical protein
MDADVGSDVYCGRLGQGMCDEPSHLSVLEAPMKQDQNPKGFAVLDLDPMPDRKLSRKHAWRRRKAGDDDAFCD